MRIDNECVRDILFTIEETSTFEIACRMIETDKYPRLKKYDIDKIDYHIRYLKLKGLIFNPDPHPLSADNYDLMPDGHEFLANVREDSNWNKIKGLSSSIGFASLKAISAIAEGVATAAINKQLGFSE